MAAKRMAGIKRMAEKVWPKVWLIRLNCAEKVWLKKYG
jgi:hypothetical protein